MNDAWLVKVFGRPIFIHLLGASLFAGVFGAVGYFAVLPLREKRLATMQEVDRLATTVQKNRKTFGELEELRKEFSKTEKRAEAIRQRIPANRQEAEVLEKLSQLAQQHNLDIVDYRRGGISDGKQFSRVQIELHCEGSFPAICHFIDAVNKLKRLTTIDLLQIRTTENSQRYPVDMNIALYYGHSDDTAMNDPVPNAKVVTR